MQHSLLILIESLTHLVRNQGVWVNSLKKGNLWQKSFYQIMLNEVLKEVTRNKRSGGFI